VSDDLKRTGKGSVSKSCKRAGKEHDQLEAKNIHLQNDTTKQICIHKITVFLNKDLKEQKKTLVQKKTKGYKSDLARFMEKWKRKIKPLQK
jgi:hypothetical protein